MGTRSQRTVVIPLLMALIALAWLTLWAWGQSPYGRFLNHNALSLADFSNGLIVPLIVTGWTVMIVAMMLPTSLPLLAMFHRMTRQRPDRLQLVWLLIFGYLGVWTLFGLVAIFCDGLLHEAVEQNVWLETNAWLIGAGILVVAGLYQFTPLKYYCLEKCRSPLHFLMTHWQGRHDRANAFRLGVRHGLFCLGCCWSLMLLMFAVGAGNLGWMLLLGALMAIEKNLPWGRRFSAPLGVVLVGWGGLEAVLALA
jgi:predicted metal-binding membrane protein